MALTSTEDNDRDHRSESKADVNFFFVLNSGARGISTLCDQQPGEVLSAEPAVPPGTMAGRG